MSSSRAFLSHPQLQRLSSPNPNEVMQTRWVHMSELMAELSETPDIYTPWMRIYMAEHAERIFGKNGAADDRGGNL
mgnify:CR=1 FL=1